MSNARPSGLCSVVALPAITRCGAALPFAFFANVTTEPLPSETASSVVPTANPLMFARPVALPEIVVAGAELAVSGSAKP